jgi:hypothetical protein
VRVCMCANEAVTACVVRCTGLGSSQWILTVSLPASTAVAECRGSTAVSLSCLSIGASSNFALPAAALGIAPRHLRLGRAAHRRKQHIATIERDGAARCSHSGQHSIGPGPSAAPTHPRATPRPAGDDFSCRSLQTEAANGPTGERSSEWATDSTEVEVQIGVVVVEHGQLQVVREQCLRRSER